MSEYFIPSKAESTVRSIKTLTEPRNGIRVLRCHPDRVTLQVLYVGPVVLDGVTKDVNAKAYLTAEEVTSVIAALLIGHYNLTGRKLAMKELRHAIMQLTPES